MKKSLFTTLTFLFAGLILISTFSHTFFATENAVASSPSALVVGTVTAKQDTRFTIKQPDGKLRTLQITPDTEYFLGENPASYANLMPGMLIEADDLTDRFNERTTRSIRMPQAFLLKGYIVGKGNDNFTLRTDWTNTRINLDADTYFHHDSESLTFAKLETGMYAEVQSLKYLDHSTAAKDIWLPSSPNRPTQAYPAVTLTSITVQGDLVSGKKKDSTEQISFRLTKDTRMFNEKLGQGAGFNDMKWAKEITVSLAPQTGVAGLSNATSIQVK